MDAWEKELKEEFEKRQADPEKYSSVSLYNKEDLKGASLRFKIKYWFSTHKRKKEWKKQRAERGFSDRDVWGFDYYLLSVIGHGMKHLAATSHSYPHDYETFEKWAEDLNKYGDAFLRSCALQEWAMSKEEFDKLNSDFNEAFDWLKERFFDLWD